MTGPLIPPPIAELGARLFSFQPAIRNIANNKWVYHSATWSEVIARNTKTNETVSIPRRYVGDIWPTDSPLMMVRLLTELEYRSGAVCPVRRAIIEMPIAVNDSFRTRSRESAAAAPVIAIRLDDGGRSRVGKLIVGGIALGLAGCVLAISLYRGGIIAARAFYAPALPQMHHAGVEPLGAPARP